jgi:hypothetical protein
MKPIDVINAFSGRGVSDKELSSSEFEDMACSLARLRESDQLELLPILMAYVLRHHKDGVATNFGEMIVFRLMPQPNGWVNLIEKMSKREVECTLEWLVSCKSFPFTENCKDELYLAIDLFDQSIGV